MAVLWFIHADAMYGFPAYELPVSDIIRKLGGEAYFKFLCRLPLSVPENIIAITSDLPSGAA